MRTLSLDVVTQYSAEATTKMLIILYMNDLEVKAFEFLCGKKEYPVSEGEVICAYKNARRTLKYILHPDQAKPGYLLCNAVVIDPASPPADLIDSNGKEMSKKDYARMFHTKIAEGEAEKLAEDLATWLITEIKKGG